MGLTLWIVPKEEDSRMIEKIMHLKPKASILRSEGSYPKFHPHITLASKLPDTVENDLDTLHALIPYRNTPLKCSFSSVDVGDAYFRSVYVSIQPSSDILDLHRQIHENLQLEPRTPIFPHLSLVYITDKDAEKGERLIYHDLLKQTGRLGEGDREHGEKRVSLKCGPDQEERWMNSFDATELWAVKCEGPVEGWKVLKKYAFVNS